MKYILLTMISVCMMFSAVSAFDGDAWIVAGDDVRARSEPSVNGKIVTSLKAGTVVRVIENTQKRDKFLKDDDYGFYWYYAEIPGNKKGWIYGKFLYQMNGETFVADTSAVLSKEFTIAGKKYYFGIAAEEAYPAADDNGLTGSDTHGLPFFVQEDGAQAVLLKTESIHTFEDEGIAFPYYFKLTAGEGGEQKVKSVEVLSKSNPSTLKIVFEYDLQDGGGEFTITAKYQKEHFTITDYQQKESAEE